MIQEIGPADWTAEAARDAAGFAVAYLLGSIPFGLVLGKLAGAGDLRTVGSGNIGATNVLRTGKRWAAVATLICDAGKGAAAVALGRIYGAEVAAIAAVGAVIGHVFPVWLKFHGGKGVATFIGAALALYWPAGLLTIGTWLTAAAAWRISSLSALIAAAAAPVYFALFGRWLFALAALLLAILIFATHRANIARLVRGDEPRIGAKTKAPRA